jgi:outer membrane protein OmpA-like peptidoglycan-associated protein
MAELYENAKRILTDGAAVEALSNQQDQPGFSATLSAIDYGLPVVVDALRSRAEDSTGIVDLLNRLRTMETTELDTGTMWTPDSALATQGPDYARLLLQRNHGRSGMDAVATKLADRARVSTPVAESVLAAAAWTVCGLLKDLCGPTVDRHTMLALLQRERDNLAVDGWDPWLRAVESERMAIMAVDTTQVPAPEPPMTASDQRSSRYPPPVSRPARQSPPTRPSAPRYAPEDRQGRHPGRSGEPGRHGQDGLGRYGDFDGSREFVEVDDRSRPPGAGLDGVPPPVSRRRRADQRPQPARHRPLTQSQGVARHTRPRAAAPASPSRRWWPVLLGVLTVAVLAAVVFWLLNRDDGDTAATLDDAGQAIGAESEPADAAGEGNVAADGSTEAETLGAVGDEPVETEQPAAPAISADTLVTMQVSMVDAFGGSDAEGVMSLEFLPYTGEVCYEVQVSGLATPFDGHIHAGTAQEKGGIVVDFGALEDGSTGCLENEPNDIQAVLAEPAAYYTEMHDPDRDNGPAIRGQLSEATDLDDPEGVFGRPLPGSEGPLNIDPDGGGALIEIEGGSIILTGAVADEAAAQQVRDSLAGIDLGESTVDDQLSIEEGSPLPSGRIVVSDAIFFDVGSSELAQADAAVLDLLARIFQARPEWSMTIVGHTDSTGNDVINLELSLARADAVRTALVDRGVEAMSLKIRGAGATEPRAENTTEGGRSQNRRIEFEIEAR